MNDSKILPSQKRHFSRWFAAAPDRLHFAAHSHHPWPDVSFDAQAEAWNDAVRLSDTKWEKIFGEVIPEAQSHIARELHLPDPKTIAFATSTHELVLRAISALEGKGLAGGAPLRVLTTDGEFHSFVRQLGRLEEAGLAFVERVPVEPFGTLGERLAGRIREAAFPPDVIYTSHVFYNSGWIFEDLAQVVAAAKKRAPEALFFVDGYHAFMALPVDLSGLHDHIFYLAGGYKYAMSGEGVCFAHCPKGFAPRPVNTGWFAGFGDLTRGVAPGTIPFSTDAFRLWGATYDPTALYRFNAVQTLWQRERVSVAGLHFHVRALQERFLRGLAGVAVDDWTKAELLPGASARDRGNFLTFRTPRAGDLHAALRSRGVLTDFRGERLRFGFGVAHDPEDVDRLLEALTAAPLDPHA